MRHSLAYCRGIRTDRLSILVPGLADEVAEDKKSKHKYLLLHIGKTGGTSLGTLVRKLKVQDADLQISKLGHRWTLEAVAKKRPNTKIGFVVREPASRFVSSFNSRLRSGRPSHERHWRTSEAIVYAFFPTANDLAEALCSDDERMKSAAQYAMQSIGHLSRGYEFHLGGIGVLKRLNKRIYCVCDIDDLNDRVFEFFAPLGFDEADIKGQFEHKHKGNSTSPLSDLAVNNLRTVWAKEFEIYDYCRKKLFTR